MQYNYRSGYLVVINENTYVSVYKNENCNFDQPFLSFQAKNFFIGKSKFCQITQFSEAFDSSDFDGITISLDCEDSEYAYISGLEFLKFKTDDKIIEYISLMGDNMVPHAFPVGTDILISYTIVINILKTTKLKKEL